MKRCKDFKKAMTDLVSGEIDHREMVKVSSHIEDCQECRDEYDMLMKVKQSMMALDEEYEQVEQQIDWQDMKRRVSNQARYAEPRSRLKAARSLVGLKILVPVMGAFFIMGITLGYFLFRSPVPVPERMADIPETNVNVVETVVARKEILDYLRQSQLVIMELMKQCNSSDLKPPLSLQPVEKARFLLKQSKYFRQNLDEAQLMTARNLLLKIELLLYEIVAMDNELSCQQLNRLQLMVERERLLLKIRIVEKELGGKRATVNEV